VLSRMGANSKVVLTHDVAQRDNLRVGRHDGVVAVVERLKGHPLFAHVTLTRCNPSWQRAQAERFHSEVQGSWGEEFLVEEGVLYRSRLSPRGAQYQVLERFPLRAPEPA